MPKYFDIHSHLNFKDYDLDKEEVIARLKETDTHTITVGTDLESSKSAIELSEKYENIYACIGVHPVNNPSRSFEKEKFEALIKHPKVVAVGECGMDFFHADKTTDYERQKNLFLEQLDLAIKHNKPVMIHARNAYEEIIEILEHYPSIRGNVHFFAGSWEVAQKFLKLGFTMSFTGVITFTKDYDEVIRNLPLEAIMSETDAPYVAPVPHRGKRNEPSFVNEVVKRIAEIRGEDEETLRAVLVNNALSMIG